MYFYCYGYFLCTNRITQVYSSIQKLLKVFKVSFHVSVTGRFLKLASYGGRVLHSSIGMNSTGRDLVFTEANVQGQFLLVSRYEFHYSINATFTIQLCLWF